ncbi:MAG: hypothetical protein G01um101425_962 [Candidatus Peregrinibacteria bacterium Gr01-1014_25]|nr:MAG: hypothetical protein G01um101425_962 [Candidatus Peregrinibacteria bacterium Gr01-1014_25]
MSVATNAAARLEQLDRQMLSLLAQRVRAYQEMREEMEEGEDIQEDVGGLVMWWAETAEEEEGLDPAAAAHIGKSVLALCRRMAE